MGFDQEPQRAQTTPTQVDQTQDKPGKTTRVEPTGQSQQKTEVKPEGDARLEQLIAQLEKQFVRNPEAARQTAVTLSVEFPDRFDAAWVLRIYEQIKDAAWRKDKIATVNAAWDDRPGTARAALAELRGKYRGDKQLLRWAKAMERQIEAHQTRLRLEADVHAWDRRPSPAQVAARELHRLWPRNYPKSWLAQIEKQIWQFQDVKWAAKISDAELTAALGENAIDWNDAPLEVKQELQIQLGRKKADLYYGKGGRGAKDDRSLVLTDASRTEVLARSERVAPVDGDFKGWTKKEDIPVKRLEVVGQQYDKKADELLGSQIAQQQQSTNPLLANRPDVFTTLYNQSLVKQAEEYRQRGAQYQALVANIRSGATSIDAERKKIERDLAAIDWALRNQIPQLRAYEQEKEKGGSVDDKIAETRAYIEQLEKHEAVLKQVMSDPKGVIPGAGAVSAVMPTGPSMGAPDAATIQASRQVAQVTDTIQAWTGGENPEGIQKNLQEMAIGLTRLKGRFDMMSAGIYRMVGNLGSYVLPDSVTGPILGMADQMRALGMAFTTANTKFTKDGEAIQMKYVAEGGTIPMIDRVFSTQKIFEKPDVAILSFLQAMPQTKGVSLALQIGINAAQTVEAFFSTYGRTGQLTPAIQAAGWSAVQGTVGIVLDKLGVPPGAQLVANITMIYGFGKMRGLSNEQIQEEIAFALVATAVGAGTSATKRGSLSGIGGKSRDIVTAIEEGNGKQTLEEAPRMDVSEETLAKSQRIDDAANQLAAAIETQRTMMRELQVLQQSKQPTKQKLTEIESSMQTVNDRRAAMKTAMTEARTVGTSQIKVTTTEATPTRTTKPVEAESTTQPKELPKRDVPKDAKRWIEGDDGRQIYKLADETFIDGDGRVTDSDGTLIDKDGNWVDVYGRRVDGAGRLVDAQGNLIDAQGRLIDKTGKLVEAAEQASLSERDVIGNNFRAKFGEKVIAFRGIRVPKGTKVLGTYKGGSKHGQMIVFDAESALHYARNPAYDPPGGAAAADEIIVIQFEVTADQIVHDPYGTMEHVFVDTDITKLPGYKETRIAKDTVTDENEASIASQIRGGTTLK